METIKEIWNDPCTWALFTGMWLANITKFNAISKAQLLIYCALFGGSFLMWIKKKLELKNK